MNKLTKLVRQGFASISKYPSGAYGVSPWSYGRGGGFDWAREAGVRYDNSVVFAAVQFASNAMVEAEVGVRKKKLDGSYIDVGEHPIVDLLHNPNPWYDYHTLMSGWVISELTGRQGMSFTYKHRSGFGKLVGLEYLPHFAVYPVSFPGTTEFIDHYRLTVSGGIKQISVEDILAQRFGPINPAYPQTSFGPLESVLLEICTDKQAAAFTAALLKNQGYTPHMISPKLRAIDGIEVTFTEEQISQLQETFERRIAGDNRGRPLVSPLPIDVTGLSFSPTDMNLDAIRTIPEERICSALRIPPGTLNLGTGLDSQNNRATAEAIAKQAARDFVLPYYKRKALQLTRGLIPELGQVGEEVYFKTDKLIALQEDATELANRDKTACGGAWMSINEIRIKNGLQPLDGDEFNKPRGASVSSKDDFDEQNEKAGTNGNGKRKQATRQ